MFDSKTICFLFWVIGYSFCLNGQTTPKKVLFVGNSYTYFWNLPQNVDIMADHGEIDIMAVQSTAGGSHWGHHWRSDRNLQTRYLLEKNHYDMVILQNHSMSTINRKDSFMIFGERMADLVRESGTQVYLYETWARKWDPFMQKEISKGYESLAEKIDAKVIPVGQAWHLARKLRPDIPLYDEDGSHPSALGTYLTACVVYASLFDKSPIGLPGRLQSEDKAGQKLMINIQSDQNALFCQKVAHEMVFKTLD